MKTQRISTSSIRCLIAALAAALLGGCACGGRVSCGPDAVGDVCYAVWPCFGYHSTCWHPWPEECVTCPSPYSPLQAEAIQSLPPSDTLQPVPTAPIPQPMPPAEAERPPVPAVPSEIPGQNPQGESSSRRRSLEGQYSLGDLRWAPTGSP